MKNGMDLGRFAAQPALRLRPPLLLLAAFLASAPLFPPNARLMLRFSPEASPAGEFLLAMLLSCLVCALAVLLYSTQHPSWPGFEAGWGRAVASAGAALYAAALTALWTLLSLGCSSVLLFAALGMMAGAGIVPVIMRWVRLYLMDFRNVMLYGAIACAGSSAAAWFVSLLPDLAAVLSESVLVVAGSLLPLMMRGGEPPKHDEAASSAPTGLGSPLRAFLSIVWVPLLGFLVCSFMMAAYSFDVAESAAQSEYIGGLVASAIVVALCAVRTKTPFVMLVDRLAIPACVAASIVLGSFPAGSPLFIAGALLVYVPLTLLSLFALSSLVAMAAAGELPLPFVFSAAFLLSCLASLLGMTVQANASPDVDLGPCLWIMLSVYFGLVVVHLGYASWKQACSLEDPGAPGGGAAQSAGAADKLQALRGERIAALAAERSLTKREQEILQYLSLGHGSVFIAKTLFISDNTVRTHIRNIYRKLNVGSREELLALVNGLREA